MSPVQTHSSTVKVKPKRLEAVVESSSSLVLCGHFLTIAYVLAMVLGAALNFSKLLVLGRLLHQSDFGLYFYITTVVQYVIPLATLGILDGLSRRVPLLIGRGQTGEAHRVRNACLGLLLLVLAGCALVATMAAATLYWAGRPAMALVTILSVGNGATFVLFSFGMRDVRSTLRTLSYGLLICGRGLLDLLAIALLAPQYGIVGVLLAETASLATVAAVIWIWLMQRPGISLRKLDRVMKSTIHDGALIALNSLLSNTALLGDRLILGLVLSKADFAVYVFHMLVFVGALNVTNIVGQYVLPRVLNLYGQTADREAVFRYLSRLGAALFSLAIVASCVIPLLFQWVAQYFFADYPVNNTLLIVILAAASFEVANVFPMGLTAYGHLGLLLRIRLVTGILVVVSTFVLVGHTTNLLPFGLVFLAGRILTFISALVAARFCSRNQQAVPPSGTGVSLG